MILILQLILLTPRMVDDYVCDGYAQSQHVYKHLVSRGICFQATLLNSGVYLVLITTTDGLAYIEFLV